jgi:hypothetical protein
MAPDLGSSTGRIRRCIVRIGSGGGNAIDGGKDKQNGGIIFSASLKSSPSTDDKVIMTTIQKGTKSWNG